MYVAYDLKGVQAQIFAVPKLKTICGTSSLLAGFDEASTSRAHSFQADLIFAGGGRGVFWCADSQQRNQLVQKLVSDAHQCGFDLRIGVDANLSAACHHADQLFPFLPDSTTGEPCALSGRWPVAKTTSKSWRAGIHPVMLQRLQAGREDLLGKSLIEDLLKTPDFPEALKGYDLKFIRNIASPAERVSPETDEDRDWLAWEQKDGDAAANAIGTSNRWAIICLDGNDVGKQFLAYEKLKRGRNLTNSMEQSWIREFSQALVRITRQAFLEALLEVIRCWLEDNGGNVPALCTYRDPVEESDRTTLVLPCRPLILGGDDVTLITNPRYAMRFVRTMSRSFSLRSQQEAQRHRDADVQAEKQELWPATNAQLTISAGVLFAKTTFPLHLGIELAESLLKNAKSKYRAVDLNSSEPTPAAVDWESITESLVQSPRERRERELEFTDQCEEEKEKEFIKLYRRPYLLADQGIGPTLSDLDKLADVLYNIPRSVRSQLLTQLRQPKSLRILYLASVAKRHAVISQLLAEWPEPGTKWYCTSTGNSQQATEVKARETDVLDALMLLEEEHRLGESASIA